MKTAIFRTLISTAVLALLAVSPLAAAGKHRSAGHARGGAVPVVEGDLIKIPVTIDLNPASVDDRPVVLSGYLVAVSFDAKKVAFVSAGGGTDPNFKGDSLYFTTAAKANEEGVVRVAAVQQNHSAPTGVVNPAVLQFRQLVPGGAATIKVAVEDLVTTLVSMSGELAVVNVPVEKPNAE